MRAPHEPASARKVLDRELPGLPAALVALESSASSAASSDERSAEAAAAPPSARAAVRTPARARICSCGAASIVPVCARALRYSFAIASFTA